MANIFSGGQNNKRDYSDNINTNGFQLFNKDGFDPSTLVIGYWNSYVTLKIHPAKEKSQQTDSSVYDYGKSIAVTLTDASVYELATLISKQIIPAAKDNKELTLTVLSGANNGVIISTGVALAGGKEAKPYLALVKGIDPTTRVPESIIAYEFNRKAYISGYSGKTEDKFEKTYHHNELAFFGEALYRISMDFTGGTVHMDKVIKKKFNSEEFKLLKALATNLNVDFYAGGMGRGNGGPTFTGNSKLSTATGSNSQGGTAPVVTTNLDNLANFG